MSSNKPGRRRSFCVNMESWLIGIFMFYIISDIVGIGSLMSYRAIPNMWGAYDEKIPDMASYARSEKNMSNASRNLNGLIHRKNKTLGVRITSVLTPIRVSRRRRVQQRPWPVLHLEDWLETGFKSPYSGFYFLGGLKLNNLVEIESLLSDFWGKHSNVEGNKPAIPSRTIPVLIHGDEGRGQAKRPLLVISFQPIIGWTGADNVNSRKSFGISIFTDFIVIVFFLLGYPARANCIYIFLVWNPDKAHLHYPVVVHRSPCRDVRPWWCFVAMSHGVHGWKHQQTLHRRFPGA